MELFLHQVLAGLATGGIYALMALAIVMIYSDAAVGLALLGRVLFDYRDILHCERSYRTDCVCAGS
jgi:hypothetical protein